MLRDIVILFVHTIRNRALVEDMFTIFLIFHKLILSDSLPNFKSNSVQFTSGIYG